MAAREHLPGWEPAEAAGIRAPDHAAAPQGSRAPPPPSVVLLAWLPLQVWCPRQAQPCIAAFNASLL